MNDEDDGLGVDWLGVLLVFCVSGGVYLAILGLVSILIESVG